MNKVGLVLVVAIGLAALADVQADVSKEEILSGADERIIQNRMADVVLRLVGPDGKALREGLPVQIEQRQHKFLFGCNIFMLNRCRTADDNEAYKRYFSGLFNYATLPFYWWSYTQEEGKPADARTDDIIGWCTAHDVTMKGHPLAWNYVDPRWLPNDPLASMGLQMDRIERCVQRFAGDIDIWDVVNEATQYSRRGTRTRAPKLTKAIDQMGVGKYVRDAFRRARAANPEATLLINDYRTDPAYIDKVLTELVDEQGNAFYDVIGIQSHMHGRYWGAEKTWAVCERFAKFGKPLHFTETTLVSGPRTNGEWDTTPEGEERQATEAVEFYTVLFSHPAVEAITWWDFSDQGAWQDAPAGFLREDMTPKPMYDELKKLIKGKWWTQTSAKVSADGTVAFRGFLGDYDVVVKDGERELVGRFRLDRHEARPIEVIMRQSR
jgi:endo-1,4-beta-xylanase